MLVEHTPEADEPWRVAVDGTGGKDPIDSTPTKQEALDMARNIARDRSARIEIQNTDKTWKAGPDYGGD